MIEYLEVFYTDPTLKIGLCSACYLDQEVTIAKAISSSTYLCLSCHTILNFFGIQNFNKLRNYYMEEE